MSRTDPLPPSRKHSPFYLSKAAIHGRIPMEPGDLRATMARLNVMFEMTRDDEDALDSTLAICLWVREHLPRRKWVSTNWRMFIILDFLADNEASLRDIGLMRDLQEDGMSGIHESLIDALATVRFTNRTSNGDHGFHYGIAFDDVLKALRDMKRANNG